jgi:alanine dehydrogenase
MAHSEDFYVHRQNLSFDKKDFYQNPTQYKSQFIDYAMHADVFIACAYWNPGADILFTREDMRKSNFKLRVIGDITCDLNGSIPSTLRTSSIDNPFYDYNPYTEDLEVPFGSEKNITVMAIDNLPCELARDASSDFGNQLIKYFLDELIMHGMESELVKRATILHEGKLTPRFEYLQDYLE